MLIAASYKRVLNRNIYTKHNIHTLNNIAVAKHY